MRLKILILCQNQFGTHIDTYFYCRYLRKKYQVTYIGWDYELPRQSLEQVTIKYISRDGNIAARNIRYFRAVIEFLRSNPVDICFIKYFRGCSVLRLFFRKIQFVFDIRSGAVADNPPRRFLYDYAMWIESLFFNNVTIISQSLAKRLRLSNKATLLPLGSVTICDHPKTFETLDLIYAGTFTNRNLEKTIIGFAGFISNKPTSLQSSYTIIGSGHQGEEEILRSLIKEYRLEQHVNIVGHVPFSELGKYFQKANIGISFVPKTSYFDKQPVTKTFDYFLSGMVVIGTSTYEHKLVIDESNGILIEDTSSAFKDGLTLLYEKRKQFCSQTIMQNSEVYHWKNIVHKFDKYLFKLTVGAKNNEQ